MKRSLVLVVLAVTGACTRDLVDPTDGPLVLQVAVARPVIGIGDTTSVTARLRNLSPFPVTITSGGCAFLPLITAQPSGEVVYPSGSLVCTLELRRWTLGAGGERTLQFRVRGVADSGTAPAVALPLGNYLVQATFQAVEYRLRSEPVALTVE